MDQLRAIDTVRLQKKFDISPYSVIKPSLCRPGVYPE
jgi:hypothetical protein